MVADPSMFSSLDIQQTPCGNCSVRLQHFIAYVHGAANMTTLAGPALLRVAVQHLRQEVEGRAAVLACGD